MDVFETACRRAVAYRTDVGTQIVKPQLNYRQMLERFAGTLPETGIPESAVINELADLGEPGLMPVTHPRFYGWVMGASSPVGVAADWLAAAWGQNAGMHSTSPTAAAVEEIAAGGVLEILDLPHEAAVGFVTGATAGSFAALAAARGALLGRVGWNCEADGLFGAPQVHVFVGDDVHASVLSSLRYLGFGDARVIRVDTDNQGRMLANDLARCCAARKGPKLIIAQAGQINTGAFDPFVNLADIARDNDAWLHVDAAFGLWARAVPDLKALTEGIERADSWVVDGHKWLQVPFDSGYAIVRDADALQRSMAISASYLPTKNAGDRVPSYLVPELSRRARGLPTWAVLKSLGRSGVISMIRHHCALARIIAEDLTAIPGILVMNDVVLNQIIVRFGDDSDGPVRRKVLAIAVMDQLAKDGIIFTAGAAWRGEWVMRISVISGAISDEDAAITSEAIRAAWAQVLATSPLEQVTS